MHVAAGAPPYDVVVIENLDVVRRGLHSLSLTHPHVVASMRMYASVEEIDFEGPAPDVILLDYWLGRENQPSVSALPALKRWGAHVLLYTTEETPFRLREALRLGADGLCLKNDGIDALAQAIMTVGSGMPAFSSPLARAVLDDSALGARLTETEIETLRGLSYGLTHAEIAARRHVEQSTINTHVENIRRKYAETAGRAVNRSRMVREGLRDGYLDARPDPREDP